MNYADLRRVSFGALPSQKNRVVRLHFGEHEEQLEDVVLPQRVDIRESLFGGIDGCVSCVSTNAGIPLTTFLGLPVSVQLVTDQGALHAINGIIVDAREGESDNSLSTYQLFIRDALSILERRINTRIFRQSNVLDIIQTLVGEWRQNSEVLGGAFYLDVSDVDRAELPVREQTVQFDESDAAFIRRLCRREGIGWFIRAGKPGQKDPGKAGDTAHTLVLYDNAIKLNQSAVGSVAYRSDATLGERDAITLLCVARQLVPGSIRRFSWDHKRGQTDRIQGSTNVDQGKAGNDLGQLLMDSRLDAPHIADSWAHYDQLGLARVKSHRARAAHVDGASGVRDLVIGEWIEVTGLAEEPGSSRDDRRFTITSLHHRAENNLPKDLHERAQALFTESRWSFDSPPVSLDTPKRPSVFGDSTQARYENTFSGVPRSMPLTPAYDPHVDLPRVHPIIGVVVTPDGEEVFCNAYGQIKVQLQGLDPKDHEHANGAGTSGTDSDSAWVRVMTGLAGDNFGENWLPRKGMEVVLDFLSGDPDKIYVAGVFHGGTHMPATFTNTGALPGNRFVSGVKTREVKGRRYNQLRLDDTPSEISAQLGSEHEASEVNLGFLTHPRTNGVGEARGEGAEVRTDAAAALRAAKGILLTTYARNKAEGHQLDRDELNQLLGECMELFKSLGDYAGQHGGQAADAVGQKALADAVKDWQPSGAGSAKGLMAFGAEAGSVQVTPKTHVTYSGENIDQVAQQHLQLMSGQRLNATAGQGMQLFARGKGVQAIAGEGPVLLQAQADTLTANAQKGVTISTNENEVLVTAPTIRLVAEDGSYIKIGGGVTLGTNGDINLLSASHKWGGPSTQQATKSAFNNAPTDQRFRLHYPAGADGEKVAAANKPYRITLDDGRVIEGKSDANGLTEVVKDEAMRILKIDILKPTN
ncbi:type VI secretion system tip protein VgrG [Trinickia dabaoshanensis]|uniref:Type VI secretion system tip protein VgrG n=1 Tax=Trinickia dabaoshanensis TaxID=564714 RepID=A0A2N7VBD8_9BURK|nr:type VI secretion system Vgr family protein [Trinickia dabaoshanensis]PMS14437.1 type VI secretion system tip protein VgrG [Trinickia dabaoshanensis]